MCLSKVYVTKPYSHVVLFNIVHFEWATKKEVTFKVLELDLFKAQFHYLRDRNRVMEGEPWLFRGASVVRVKYYRLSSVNNRNLDKIPVCVHVQGVPNGSTKGINLAKKVAKKVGESPCR